MSARRDGCGFAHGQLRHLFPRLPQQPGYNKRARKLAATMCELTRVLATDTSLWADDVWVIDSTPVECGPPADLVVSQHMIIQVAVPPFPAPHA